MLLNERTLDFCDRLTAALYFSTAKINLANVRQCLRNSEKKTCLLLCFVRCIRDNGIRVKNRNMRKIRRRCETWKRNKTDDSDNNMLCKIGRLCEIEINSMMCFRSVKTARLWILRRNLFGKRCQKNEMKKSAKHLFQLDKCVWNCANSKCKRWRRRKGNNFRAYGLIKHAI